MKPWKDSFLIMALFSGFAGAQVPDSGMSASAAADAGKVSPEARTVSDARDQAEIRNKLSTLWTCVSLNMIGADVLTSYIPGAQDEVIDFAGSKEDVRYFMLAGAVIYEIPISMILLSKYLPYPVNRWTNVGMSALSALLIWGGGSAHPHYLFIASAETAALGYIAWTALKWPRPGSSVERKHEFGLRMDPAGKGAGLAYAYRF